MKKFGLMGGRVLRSAGILLVFWLVTLLLAPAHVQSFSHGQMTAYVGAKVYPAPDAEPIDNATILVEDGRLLAVGKRSIVAVPKGTRIVRCEGLTAVAGLWNGHVHLYKPQWLQADSGPAERLSSQFRDTFLRYGFVHVVDLGSLLQNTLTLRKRVESGEVKGPDILTAGEPLYPQGGIPEAAKAFHLPQASTPAEAAAWAEKHLADGADLLKLFTAAGYTGPVVVMPPDVIRAVVKVAHAHGKLVFAHPQDGAGWQVALAGGVDVLAHTPDNSADNNSGLLQTLAAHGTVVIPTLKLWGVDVDPKDRDRVVANGVSEIHAFNGLGGDIVFGTDIGYIDDADPTEEYLLMARSGMTFPQILASLTTRPARLFGVERRTGRIAPGFDADVVFLEGDPALNVVNFAKARLVLLRGSTLYDNSASSASHN